MMSYSSAPCDDEDEMFEKDSKEAVSTMGDSSTMFADEEKPVKPVQSAPASTRPSSLNTTTAPSVTDRASTPETRISGNANSTTPSFTSPTSPIDSLRAWSSNAMLYARQYVTEHLGRRGNGVINIDDPDTMARVAALREQQRHYARLLHTATVLSGQLEQIVKTQRALGGAFGELSQCGGDVALGEQFACSTDVMRLLSKQGDNLLASLAVFKQSMSTLCNTTIEDTLATVKNCNNARIKYDAYKSRVDSLRAAQNTSRDSSSLHRLRETETACQLHKQKYDRIHSDLVIKLKFLEENKVIVCQKHLYLLHKAFTTYVSGNLQGVDDILRRCHFSEHGVRSNVERLSVKPAVTSG